MVQFPPGQPHGLSLETRGITYVRETGERLGVSCCAVKESFLSADIRPGDIVVVVNGQTVITPGADSGRGEGGGGVDGGRGGAEPETPLHEMVRALLGGEEAARAVMFARPMGPEAGTGSGGGQRLLLSLSVQEEGIIFGEDAHGAAAIGPPAPAPAPAPAPVPVVADTTSSVGDQKPLANHSSISSSSSSSSHTAGSGSSNAGVSSGSSSGSSSSSGRGGGSGSGIGRYGGQWI